MPYGSVLTDTVQSSTANTPPQFNDGNGTQVGTLCRAWVNFNGTGTVAIRSSFNVSSITDNGTGDYTVNFTNAMPDVNYCVVSSCAEGTETPSGNNSRSLSPKTLSTTSVRVVNLFGSALASDLSYEHVAVFR